MNIVSAFQNAKVRSKVIAAFALLSLIIGGLGYFATTRFAAINSNLNDISDNWLPSTRYLGEIDYLTAQYRIYQGTYLLETTEADRANDLRRLEAISDAIKQARAKYEPLVSAGEERSLADAVDSKWQKYVADQDVLFATSRSKGVAAANALFVGDYENLFADYHTALERDVAYQSKGSDVAGNKADATVSAADMLIYVAIGLGLLLSFGVGYVLVRAISGPLTKMAGAMGKLAAGQLDVEVPATGRKDEIGELATSMVAYRDELNRIERELMPNVMVSAVRNFVTPVMAVNRDFVVTFVNEATRKLFREKIDSFRKLVPGIDAEKLVGTCIDVFHKNPSHQRQMLSDPSRLPFRTDITVGDLKFALSVSAVLDASGKYIGNVLEWNDVTDTRVNEWRLAALQITQAIIEFRPDGTILEANNNFLNVMGYSLKDIVGKHHSMLVEPGFRNSVEYKEMWEKLARGEMVSGKFRRVANGGRVLWLQCSYNPVKDKAGNTIRIMKLATDVTALEDERDRAEAERAAKAAEQAKVVTALASGLKDLSVGNLVSRLNEAFAGDYEQLRADYNGAVDRLQDTMKSVLTSTSGITTGAGEISQAADDLSKRTEQQAASLEETAAALEEITATVKKTAQNAKDASTIVKTAKSAAEEGGRVVETAIHAMGQIEQSSKQITDIIGVIDEIAFQTNLLALNAGVEAARAGDAGKGFAVVASEVRALAQRSSEAAREIKTLIKTSGEQVNSGVKLVGESGEALKKIVDQVVEINTLVSEMAQAAQQQSTGIEEVNVAVNQMDQVTQQNAAMVEQSTAASRNLASETAELANLVSFFKVGDVSLSASSRSAAATVRPASVAAASRAVPRSQKMVAGGRRASAALAVKAAPAEDDWQEF
ncbi:MAG TPA: methyl-accepting chemotaxis protein [Rhizomicrobium sp.]|nr:methyl-accepting chemotaxis protein [Rhizomicrobium sp.]